VHSLEALLRKPNRQDPTASPYIAKSEIAIQIDQIEHRQDIVPSLDELR
jgi:hypothetical protein